ncbi:serine/threonine protein kinase [Bacillus altitudinis]|uniref:serine/threonine-protein kinase n=1 Tax=Bacillus altitudinis TaxID=293387 RepID=UPI00227DD714|nr:serine/threonine-protein kinase [Bacillus altitudinis]MCY7694273.1 serine/threonine protein kinase [Bacillus altitudinis]
MIKINHVKPHLSLDKWKRIGDVEGKNSEVWIARDTQLEQVLILKKITKESLDQQSVEDYFAEAKILNTSKHPHVMPIYYSAENDENVYITMPYYANGSLNTVLNKRFLTTREIIRYSLDFLSGLLFIHIKGLIHLDIKPTNVIIDDTNKALLTDFGLSKHLNENGFANQRRQYVAHRSPEAYVTTDKTVQDDIYQAGLTLYRMCNGNSDFKTQFDLLKTSCNSDEEFIKKIQRGEFPNRKSYLPQIPVKLRRIINKMLHTDIDKRYKDVLSIINDLSKIDEKMDWRYDIIEEEREFVWSLDNPSSIVTVRVEENEGKYLTSVKKYVKNSGNTQNQPRHNKGNDTLLEALAHLETVLSQYS